MKTNKNYVKRWLAVILTLSMMLSTVSITALAATGDGMEFDEQTGILGSDVATYAANPDGFVEDSRSPVAGEYLSGLTVYVIVDNGVPSGKAYSANRVYSEKSATSANHIDKNSTFNSYLVYSSSKLYGVLFLQDDSGELWKTIAASMLNNKTVSGLNLPMTIAEAETIYDREEFTSEQVQEIASKAPADICVTDLTVYVLSHDFPKGMVFDGDSNSYVSDISGDDFISYLCYNGRVLEGLLFVQKTMLNDWLLNATNLCDGLTIKGFDNLFIDEFAKAETPGIVVEALAADPELFGHKALTIFVINRISEVVDGVVFATGNAKDGFDPYGRVYTAKDPYDMESLLIDPYVLYTSYVCYLEDEVAGLLFVENVEETFEWKGIVKDLLGDMVPAKADLPREYPEVLTHTITVKEFADQDSVKVEAFRDLQELYGNYPIIDIDWSEADFTVDGTVTATIEYENGELATVVLVVYIEPVAEWNFLETLPEILATAKENSDYNELLDYVNQVLTAKPVLTEDYKAALGKASDIEIPEFTWNHCDRDYVAKGGVVYTFTQNYNGVTFTRTVSVKTAKYEMPDLEIDYVAGTVNTTAGMRWSLNKNDPIEEWYVCTDNMRILKDWVDNTVYFVMAATEQAEGSAIVKLDIPEYAEIPEYVPELIASSHSITVTNAFEYTDAEFSLDGITWIQPDLDAEYVVFDNLEPNTKYTVYVRTCAWEDLFLASNSIFATIYTSKTVATKSELTYDDQDDVGYITLDVELASSFTDGILSGVLDKTELSKVDKTLSKYLRQYDTVEVAINIEQLRETGDMSKFSAISLTMPISLLKTAISKADTKITYHNEYFTVVVTDEQLSEMIKRETSLIMQTEKLVEAPPYSSLKWIKTQMKEGADAYYLVYGEKRDSFEGCEIRLSGENLKEDHVLCVTHVSSRGALTELDVVYDEATKEHVFNYTESGYYVIAQVEKSDTTKPGNGTADDKDNNEELLPPMNFADVSATSWMYSGVQYCYTRQIMVGTSGSIFSPNSYVSKAQIVTIVARLAGVDLDAKVSATGFSDVDPAVWYAPAAAWAKSNGIITDATFDGNKALSRQDIAGILYAYLSKVEKMTVSNESLSNVAMYDDVGLISTQNLTAVSYLRCLGLMNGVGENMFNPNGYVTRAQMATMAMRLDMLINP